MDRVHRSPTGCSEKEEPTFAKAKAFASVGEGGGEESRTPVQTYSSKAFYMFILFYCVRDRLGTNNLSIP